MIWSSCNILIEVDFKKTCALSSRVEKQSRCNLGELESGVVQIRRLLPENMSQTWLKGMTYRRFMQNLPFAVDLRRLGVHQPGVLPTFVGIAGCEVADMHHVPF